MERSTLSRLRAQCHVCTNEDANIDARHTYCYSGDGSAKTLHISAAL